MSDIHPDLRKAQRWGYAALFAMSRIPFLVLLLAFVWLMLPILIAEGEIKREKLRLAHRIDHRILASAYDTLQEDGKIIFSGASGTTSIAEEILPSEIRILKPNYVYFDVHAMYLEFGGGFHHFGIKILRLPIDDLRPRDDEERKIDERSFIYDHGG